MTTAILFDMNGVIIDDEPLHEQAFRDVLQSYNISLTHQAYQKHFLGRSDRAGFEHLNQEQPLPKSFDELYTLKMKKYLQLTRAGTPLVADIQKTIQQLAASHTLALTTGATKLEVEAIFTQYPLADYFSIVVTLEDFSKSKPDPEPYLLTAQKLNIESAECVVIENAIAGITSAHAAGMKCITITTSLNAVQLSGADLIVTSANEITTSAINNLTV